MIIKNMEEFGKAVDDGLEFEWEGAGGLWAVGPLKEWRIPTIQTYISTGRIRTAPQTIELFEYQNITGRSAPIWLTEAEAKIRDLHLSRTHRTGILTINEGDGE